MAGCSRDKITAALQAKGLLHEIRDQTGRIVASHARKGIWLRPNGEVGLNGVKPADMLYGLELLSKHPDKAVVITEGEKAADALRTFNLVALGTVTGAAGTPTLETLKNLEGRRVALWPDNDDLGRQHMDRVARLLIELGVKATIVNWPAAPPKGDAADLVAAGVEEESLRAMLQAAEPFNELDAALPAGVTRAGRARLYDLGRYNPAAEAAGIDWLIQDWLVRGEIHLFVGEEKRGKSTQEWHRVSSVSRGKPHHGSTASKGRVLVVTEMGPSTIRGLLEDDDIEPDWDLIRVVFVDDVPRDERMAAIAEAAAQWKPDLLALDPIDECLGLDEKGIFNPSTTSDGFDLLRQWARAGMTIEGLYHFNNQGKIANSYKFRSKPDHIYKVKGTEAGDVTIEYTGRMRAIPRKRRLKGNGDNGYEVTVLAQGQAGRPARSLTLILTHLGASTVPCTVVEISKATGLPYQATQQALARGVKKGLVEHDSSGYRRASEADPQPQQDPASSDERAAIYPPSISSLPPELDPSPFQIRSDEIPLSIKRGVSSLADCTHPNVRFGTDDLLICLDCGQQRDPAALAAMEVSE
jgi:hypothetical protein